MHRNTCGPDRAAAIADAVSEDGGRKAAPFIRHALRTRVLCHPFRDV